jgi:hypothetical protein
MLFRRGRDERAVAAMRRRQIRERGPASRFQISDAALL